jgi:hypothetical protein
MSFNLKFYKRLKIQYYFRKINFFFFYHGTSLNSIDWIQIEQLLNKNELKYFRMTNTLMINILKDSIFKNLHVLIHGPIILLNTNNTKLIVKKLENMSTWISLLCLKLNTKIYSKKQIKNLKTLSYIENIFLFFNSMQLLVKMPYYKLKNRKVLQISK